MLCQKNDIRQLYIFLIGEGADINTSDANGVMGFYQNLNANKPYSQTITNEGIANKTISDFLLGYFYDPAKTSALSMGPDVEGGAFQSPDGKYVYVLWAKTKTDKSENASANYSFPTGAKVSTQLHKREWNYSSSPVTNDVSSQNITLTGSPSFFIDGNVNPDPKPPGPLATEEEVDIVKLKIFPNPSSLIFIASYEITSNQRVSIDVIDTKGKIVRKVIDNLQQYAGPQSIEIKLNDLKEGIYICRFTIGDKSFVKKIAKVN